MALLPEQAWTLPYMACATAISRAAPPSTLEGELPLAVADEEAPLAASDEEAPLAASDEEAPLTAAGASRWLSSVATTGGDCCIRGLASLQMRCAFVVGGSELLVLYCLACIAGVAQAAAFLLLLRCMAGGGRRHSEPGGLANRPYVPVLHPYYATRPRRVWEEARRPCVYLLVLTRVVLVSSRACMPMAIGRVDLCLTRCPVAATVRPTWWQHTSPHHDVVALRGVEYKEHRQT